jgi:hypothetical protein
MSAVWSCDLSLLSFSGPSAAAGVGEPSQTTARPSRHPKVPKSAVMSGQEDADEARVPRWLCGEVTRHGAVARRVGGVDGTGRRCAGCGGHFGSARSTFPRKTHCGATAATLETWARGGHGGRGPMHVTPAPVFSLPGLLGRGFPPRAEERGPPSPGRNRTEQNSEPAGHGCTWELTGRQA